MISKDIYRNNFLNDMDRLPVVSTFTSAPIRVVAGLVGVIVSVVSATFNKIASTICTNNEIKARFENRTKSAVKNFNYSIYNILRGTCAAVPILGNFSLGYIDLIRIVSHR